MLTVQQVQDAAQGASDSVTDNPVGVVEQAIRAVQGLIESHLDKPLLAHERTERVRREEWMEDEIRRRAVHPDVGRGHRLCGPTAEST